MITLQQTDLVSFYRNKWSGRGLTYCFAGTANQQIFCVHPAAGGCEAN